MTTTTTRASGQRCRSVNKPDSPYPSVRCVHTSSRAHTTHWGWAGETRVEWRDAPDLPTTPDEWRAVAWEFTGGLGTKINYDPVHERLVVDNESLGEWWTRKDPEYRRHLVQGYKASVETSDR